MARAAGASERGVAALAAALVALRLLERRPDGTIAAAADARRWLSRKSPDWRGSLGFQESDLARRTADLTDIVRSGKPSTLPRDPQQALAATLAQHHRLVDAADAIAAALPLAGGK